LKYQQTEHEVSEKPTTSALLKEYEKYEHEFGAELKDQLLETLKIITDLEFQCTQAQAKTVYFGGLVGKVMKKFEEAKLMQVELENYLKRV